MRDEKEREMGSEKHSLFLLDSLVNSMVADKKSLMVLSRLCFESL